MAAYRTADGNLIPPPLPLSAPPSADEINEALEMMRAAYADYEASKAAVNDGDPTPPPG